MIKSLIDEKKCPESVLRRLDVKMLYRGKTSYENEADAEIQYIDKTQMLKNELIIALKKLNRDYNEGKISEVSYDNYKLAILFMAYTGVRGTEFTHLKVKNFNFNENFVIVKRFKIAEEKVIDTTTGELKVKNETVVFLHKTIKTLILNHIDKYGLEKDDKIYMMKSLEELRHRYIGPRKLRHLFKNIIKPKIRNYDDFLYLAGQVTMNYFNYISILQNKEMFEQLKSEYFDAINELDYLLKQKNLI